MNTAWIVDVNSSSILVCDNRTSQDYTADNLHNLFGCFSLDNQSLSALQAFEYALINPNLLSPNLGDTVLPTVVVSLDSVINLGIIKALDNNLYAFGKKYYQLISYRTLVHNLEPNSLGAVSHAIQLLRARYDHRYCSRCGTPSINDNAEYAFVCPHCRHRNYPRIQPCIIVAIYHNDSILLAQHHKHTDGMYGLVAGFMEIGESIEQAVVREVKEEVGIDIDTIDYLSSQPWPYPTNLMIGLTARYKSGDIVVADNELTHAGFFRFDNLPKIPPKGTIARTLIDTLANTQPQSTSQMVDEFI